MSVVIAVAGLVVGFVAGLCAYTTSRRWCPTCGAALACPDTACPDGHRDHPAGTGEPA